MAVTTLCYGSRGRDVQRLQELLNKSLRHSPPLRIDGHFGLQTETAVRLYQASVGVGVDGVAGVRTWEALKKHLRARQTVAVPDPENFQNAPWMIVAMRERGQREIVGSTHNPRILEYHAATTLRASTDETPWCSAFANWCLRQVEIVGTNSAAAQSWMHWGKPTAAIVGAITVIYSRKAIGTNLSSPGYHVGFLIRDADSYYRLLGGNQNNQVKISNFPKASWRLITYRVPKP